MFYYLSKIKDAVFDVLFPSLCINCRRYIKSQLKTNHFLCNSCYLSIRTNNSLFCPVCRARLAENKRICRHPKKIFPYSYFLAPAGNYDDVALRNLIHCFKYQKFEKIASILGKITLEYIENCKLKIENFIIIPIPLHFWREKQRGFNQSKLLAEEIAQNLNLKIIDGLKRIKNNKPQAKAKNSEERNKNVEGIFKVINPDLIRGKNIILVDDVVTSGATINEAVKILKQNGVKRIIALVIAKA